MGVVSMLMRTVLLMNLVLNVDSLSLVSNILRSCWSRMKVPGKLSTTANLKTGGPGAAGVPAEPSRECEPPIGAIAWQQIRSQRNAAQEPSGMSH